MSARARGCIAALALMTAPALMAMVPAAASAQECRTQMLPGCGICYPGGYDRNTYGSVDGTVVELQVPDDGPVRFVVAAGTDRWVVLASPAWFWKTVEPRFAEGVAVTVRGSKTLGADGDLYIIASEIERRGDGAVVLVRDRSGSPLWKGAGHGDGRPGARGMGRGGHGRGWRRR